MRNLFVVRCELGFFQESDRVNMESFYFSTKDKTGDVASLYMRTEFSLSRYLPYRDLPELFRRFASGDAAMDYGCGTGISSRFLLSQGFKVVGVDISQEMVEKAQEALPDIDFLLINETIPEGLKDFDLVFSSSVLFEFESKEKISRYLKEGKRVLAKEGIFVIIMGSDHLYKKEWFISNNKFEQNKNLRSGDLAIIYAYDCGIQFTDYFWSESDLRELIEEAHLQILYTHYPKGRDEEPFPWKDERDYSPFVIYVCKRSH